jgi:aldose 1-epimerase
MHTVTLRNASLHAQVHPQAGAGLARLDYLGAGAPLPLLRPYTADAPPRANQLGCFVLVPWSNRMAGGFSFEGRHYPIAPNREGEAYPIHGEGWQFEWDVREQSDTPALLAMERRGEPFSFDASIGYALDGRALEVTLDVVNRGAVRLPFGLGLHPYLPRTAGVTLQAHTEALWIPGPDKLPAHAAPVPAAWNFAQARTLPPEAIDHVFEGWDGRARIVWPEHGVQLAIESDARYCIVYTPAGADFFCVEPVDHLINAHNVAGGPERHGLTVLAPGERLTRRFRFVVG